MSKSENITVEIAGARLAKVRVLFFGAAREETGSDESTLELLLPATVADVFEAALQSFPQLQRFGRSLLVAVNEEYKPADAEVRAGDEIAIFPPVSGGAVSTAGEEQQLIRGEDFLNSRPRPLMSDWWRVASSRRRRAQPSRWTVTCANGRRDGARFTLSTKHTLRWPVSEMRRLGAEARRKFEVTHIGIVHRTGRLEIGETSVVISVSAPHRRAAFEACEWAIRELKRTVPIWKKEFYEDGEVWIEGDAGKTHA